MTFWHGCSAEAWEDIQAEGVLWGVRVVLDEDGNVSTKYPTPDRCTYLAVEQDEAREYGEVVLRVEYEPGSGTDNHCDGCWQVRVYDPIPLEHVQVEP